MTYMIDMVWEIILDIAMYTWGVMQNSPTFYALMTIVSVIVLLTPIVNLFRRFWIFLLPKLIIITPIPIGLVGGTFAGFWIGFGKCFMEYCSIIWSSAVFTIPLATLVITIPVTIISYKRRQAMRTGMANLKPKTWIITGLIIMLWAIISIVNIL